MLYPQGKGVWRVRVLGITAGGDGPEALTDVINNLLAYDGESIARLAVRPAEHALLTLLHAEDVWPFKRLGGDIRPSCSAELGGKWSEATEHCQLVL